MNGCRHNMKILNAAQDCLKKGFESGSEVVIFRRTEDGKTYIDFYGARENYSSDLLFSSIQVCLTNLALVGFNSCYQGYIKRIVSERDFVEIELDPENQGCLILNEDDMFRTPSY